MCAQPFSHCPGAAKVKGLAREPRSVWIAIRRNYKKQEMLREIEREIERERERRWVHQAQEQKWQKKHLLRRVARHQVIYSCLCTRQSACLLSDGAKMKAIWMKYDTTTGWARKWKWLESPELPERVPDAEDEPGLNSEPVSTCQNFYFILFNYLFSTPQSERGLCWEHVQIEKQLWGRI